ncbi:RNA polymerase 1 subunit [Grosmannia clavigera kw1407]|uniref:DNA-directed RNA polymerase subunit n=1 Tax=Grosmannia clavigera (strain kw1407 / UAMH 11150) TaxID=655863 RepID=F0XRN0_GROCL|nr:RNA polymerase 1 subunit [Grosmannia clavigera kw1407]EFW99658.1 RNA polymerase 1 subunit [Grosmannia clavigera kw1407]
MPSVISYERTMDARSPAMLKKRPHDGNSNSPKERKKAKHPKTDQTGSGEGKKKSKKMRFSTEALRVVTEETGVNNTRTGFTEKVTKEQVQTGSKIAEVPKFRFPFFTQTISLWVPLYPVGFDRPISSVADQHLSGLLNHYSPMLGGYLLAYNNVNLSESSVCVDPNNPPTDQSPAVLTSIDEYAVGYGWMTVDVDLFVPSRGAWLEGTVILQNEGSIGVNCWEKFNASIEASRLPRGWKYVDCNGSLDNGHVDKADNGNRGEGDEEKQEDENKNGELEKDKEGQQPLAAHIQTTGHWTDETGMPVKGSISFRIKDFDVGLAGDNGYLAIEGTMLRPEDECRLMMSERDKNRTAKSKRKTRRLPEFSITQFGKDDEEEDETRSLEILKENLAGNS